MTQEPDGVIRPAWTVELDFAKFNRLAERHGWLKDDGYDYGLVASAFGMSERHAYRVLRRRNRPGSNFLGGLFAAAEELPCPPVLRIVNPNDPIGKD